MILGHRYVLGTAALMLALGCSSKNGGMTGVVDCQPDGSCPSGFVCQTSSNTCVTSGSVDASTRDVNEVTPDVVVPPPIDAPIAGGDAGPPDTTITQAPMTPTNQTVVTFLFTGTATTAKFQCRIDTEPFADCTTPFVTMLPQHMPVTAEGDHVFDVRAVDAGGDADPTPAEARWTLDLTAPHTTITSGPSGTTTDTSATFTFTSNEAGSTFTCSIDGGTAVACNSGTQTYPGLATGSHTFTVIATDPAGNVDPTGATQTWTIGVQLPVATITSGPDPATSSPDATFVFTATPAGATFLCSLDGATFTACVSGQMYTGLADGAHTFDVEAVNSNGTGAPAHYAWMVDSSGIVAVITGGPNGAGCSSATFTFTAAGQGVTFECELDSTGFTPCSGSVTYTGLADGGSHTFSVHAKGSDGTVGPDATQTFSVDAHPPKLSITTPANNDITGKNVNLTFTVDANTTVACDVDGTTIASCQSGVAIPPQMDGKHTVTVSATDNLCANKATASSTWTVDTIGPTVTVAQPTPGQSLEGPNGSFTFSTGPDPAGLPPKTVVCAIDGAMVPCDPNGTGSFNLPDGSHTLVITVTDALGNSTTSAPITFTLDSQPPIVTQLAVTGTLQGKATVSYELTDLSDISSVHCVLDGTDVECGQTNSGSFGYSALSPGVHDLEVYGIDSLGNSGMAFNPAPVAATRAQLLFTETYDTGRLVLIGHPVLDNGALANIVRNAVATSEAGVLRQKAGKPVTILAYHPASLDPSACDALVQALGGEDCDTRPAGYTEFTSATVLDTALRGEDVLIIPDFVWTPPPPNLKKTPPGIGQRQPRLLDFSPEDLGAMWHQSLLTFLNAGGVVIVLDGSSRVDGTLELDDNYRVLFTEGQCGRPIDGRQSDGIDTNFTLLDAFSVKSSSCQDDLWQSHDLIADVNIDEGDDNAAEFVNDDDYGINVYTDNKCGFDESDRGAQSARRLEGPSPTPPFSTVIERPYPFPVAVQLAQNNCQYDGCGDANEPVAFISAGADTIDPAVVATDRGGISIRNFPGGGTVTAEALQGYDDAQDREVTELVSFLGVEPLDTLFVRPIQVSPVNGTCTLFANPPTSAAEAPASLDIGAGNDQNLIPMEDYNTADFVGDVGPVGSSGASGSALSVPEYTSNDSVMGIQRDDSGAPTSYVLLTGTTTDLGQTCPDSVSAFQLPDYTDVNAGEGSWLTPAGTGTVTVNNLRTTLNATGLARLQWKFVLLEGVGFDVPAYDATVEISDEPSSTTAQLFSPQNSDNIWDGTAEELDATQDVPSAHGNGSDHNETDYLFRTQDLQPTANVAIDFNSTLPFLSGFNVDYTQDPAAVIPALSWQAARTATYNGQIATLSWSNAEWIFITPGVTSIDAPALLPVQDAQGQPVRELFGDSLEDINDTGSISLSVQSFGGDFDQGYDLFRTTLLGVLEDYYLAHSQGTTLYELYDSRVTFDGRPVSQPTLGHGQGIPSSHVTVRRTSHHQSPIGPPTITPGAPR